MYRKRGDSPQLSDIMARLQGRKPACKPTNPVAYNPMDVRAAKNVLDRLLAVADKSEQNEVSYITIVPDECYEE